MEYLDPSRELQKIRPQNVKTNSIILIIPMSVQQQKLIQSTE